MYLVPKCHFNKVCICILYRAKELRMFTILLQLRPLITVVLTTKILRWRFNFKSTKNEPEYFRKLQKISIRILK